MLHPFETAIMMIYCIFQAINVGIDGGIGILPILGDILDTLFKSNLRNLALLEVRIERCSTAVNRN